MMNKFNNILAGIVFSIALGGCAGSASHKVLSANQGGDDKLSCEAIDQQIAQAQAVIDGVNKDKEDISGADVIDGVLWFPFNLIAKNQNYKEALQGADKRIAQLNSLKKEKGCSSNEQDILAKKANITTEIEKLNKLYKEKAITGDEYKAAKAKLLGLK